MSKEVGLKIGKLFSPISEVFIPESGSSKGRCIKLLATLNLDRPLLRGTNIKLNNVACWVDFKYEQLASFCYYCGRIGHSDRLCAKRGEDLRKRELNEGQYGDWLKGVSGRISNRGSEGSLSVKFNAMRGENDKKAQRGAEHGRLKELYVPVVHNEFEGSTLPVQRLEESTRSENEMLQATSLLLDFHQKPCRDKIGEPGGMLGMNDSEIQPKAMTDDWCNRDKENFLASDSLVLVDIPIVHGKERLPLDSLTNLGYCQGVPAKGKGGRKWKRLAFKPEQRGGVSVQLRVQDTAEGSKRPWKLRDEAGDVSPKPEGSTKKLRKETNDSLTSMEVGVASLNWPQMDQ